MSQEKWYDQFYGKKSSRSAKAAERTKRKEYNKARDEYFDQKRRGVLAEDGVPTSQSAKKGQRGVADVPAGAQKSAAQRSSIGDVRSFAAGASDAQILSSRNLFDATAIPQDSRRVLENFDAIVQGVRPMNSRQMQSLPKDIRTLSHLLTDERGARHVAYMNATEQLSAYLRYFTWWNLVRLTRVFANLPASSLAFNDGDALLDAGSGPLTLVIALWLSRPELRQKRLTVYCMDISQSTMAVGEELYLSIAAKTPPKNPDAKGFWKIVRVKGELGTDIRKKAVFVGAANMFNEIYQKDHEAPEKIADKQIKALTSYAAPGARFFIAEPGMPVAGRFISLMRERFIRRGCAVVAPCPHQKTCPMNGLHARYGGSAKWCNFSFSTADAPQKLLKLSESAGLPKERAVISFLFVTGGEVQSSSDAGSLAELHDVRGNPTENKVQKALPLAVVSDPIRLGEHRTGFYSCTEHGMALAIAGRAKGLKSGDIIKMSMLKSMDTLPKDKKSGAVEITL